MLLPAPVLDARSHDELVAQLTSLVQRYTDWRPATAGSDPGAALVHLVAHLSEVVVARLNRLPDKNFVAFLDLLGLELRPPQAARVPLTFSLAAGSMTDTVVPAQTQVAATLGAGETEPVVFETEEELVVTRAQPYVVLSIDPEHDLHHVQYLPTPEQDGPAVALFQGDEPIVHALYLGHAALLGPGLDKDITLRFTPAEVDVPWLASVEWAYYNGVTWQLLQADQAYEDNGAWNVTLAHVPRIPLTRLGGHDSAWVRGRFVIPLRYGELRGVNVGGARTTLRRTELRCDAGWTARKAQAPPAYLDSPTTGHEPLEVGQAFAPFGITPHDAWFLACNEAFAKPGAMIEIAVELDTTQPAQPSADLQLYSVRHRAHH